ncbi:MAG: tail fiber domain-containing protein, partial [Ruminiclostridium sp.]|nr:tail fiber domain-containing protein [Ruminiclostridium sp.]
KLYGLMSVYQSKTSSSLGGYIGYSTSYFGTGGVGVLSANESGLIGAYNSGAKLIYVEPTYREAATQCAASASTLYMSAYGSGSQSYLQEQYGIRLKGFSGYAQFYPDYNTVDLGTSSYPWRNSYTTGGTWAGSDRNKKKDINYDIDSYLNVFDKLLPVSYKFKDGTSGRTHIGFIAQDVEDAILDSGMTTQDYACIAKSPKQDEEGNVIEGYDYSLRYEEFIALAIYKIKKLEARIAALEGA